MYEESFPYSLLVAVALAFFLLLFINSDEDEALQTALTDEFGTDVIILSEETIKGNEHLVVSVDADSKSTNGEDNKDKEEGSKTYYVIMKDYEVVKKRELDESEVDKVLINNMR